MMKTNTILLLFLITFPAQHLQVDSSSSADELGGGGLPVNRRNDKGKGLWVDIGDYEQTPLDGTSSDELGGGGLPINRRNDEEGLCDSSFNTPIGINIGDEQTPLDCTSSDELRGGGLPVNRRNDKGKGLWVDIGDYEQTPLDDYAAEIAELWRKRAEGREREEEEGFVNDQSEDEGDQRQNINSDFKRDVEEAPKEEEEVEKDPKEEEVKGPQGPLLYSSERARARFVSTLKYDLAAVYNCINRRIPSEDPFRPPDIPRIPSDIFHNPGILDIIYGHLDLPEDQARFLSVCKCWGQIAKPNFTDARLLRCQEVGFGLRIMEVMESNHTRSIQEFQNDFLRGGWSTFNHDSSRFMQLMHLNEAGQWNYDLVRRVVMGLFKSHPKPLPPSPPPPPPPTT